MRRISIAIVTAALLAGNIIEDMGLMGDGNSWEWLATGALLWFIFSLFFGED